MADDITECDKKWGCGRRRADRPQGRTYHKLSGGRSNSTKTQSEGLAYKDWLISKREKWRPEEHVVQQRPN